jgi:4-amino-4-deoxy-L-arabinose transferase-like glycosyltransferase
MNLSDRRIVALILVLIVAAALFLRVFNLGHPLSYDEAWNSLSIEEAAAGDTDGVFYENILRHPPLYTGLGLVYAWLTGSGRRGIAPAMEVVSLLFSLGLVVLLFLCGKEWFSQTAGLASAFLFAVMPAARVYDTWIKQESMTFFLVLLFLFMFFKGRYVIAGLSLGLAMLCKEIFIFPLLALAVLVMVKRNKLQAIGFAKAVGVGVIVSCWWYAFLSVSTGEFADFFLGRSAQALNWGNEWWYYLERVPPDIGVPGFVLAIAGLVILVGRMVTTGFPEGEEWQPKDMAFMSAAWFICVYLVLSLSVGKPPWLAYSALPAAALLGGFGASEFYRIAKLPKIAAAGITVVLALAVVMSLPVGFVSFMSDADVTFEQGVTYMEAAAYINKTSASEDTLMLRVSDFSPNLAFYLDMYRPYGLAEMPGPESLEEWKGKFDESVLLIPGRVTTEDALSYVSIVDPSIFLIRPGYPGKDGSDPALGLESNFEPEEIGNVWVFDLN